MPVATSTAGARAGQGAGRRPCSEEGFLGPQLRDKERQMIKERFKVRRGPVPSSGATAAAVATWTQTFVSFPTFLGARASMMALKNCARSRKPGLFLTQSRGTRSAKLRNTLSRRPMGPFCTGEPCAPRAPHTPSWGSALFRKTWRGVGLSGRSSALGVGVGPGRGGSQGHPHQKGLRLRRRRGGEGPGLPTNLGACSGIAACPSPRTLRSTSSTAWSRWAT